MSDVVKVAIADSFLTSFARLSPNIRRKVADFLVKFQSNPLAPGINYEKIASDLDKNVWSVRIDDKYRGIVLRQDKTGVYMLVWVDNHDEAYAWARRKKWQINPHTGMIQLYTVQEQVETVAIEGVFSAIADADLLKIGVPEEQLPLVRRVASREEFATLKDEFTADVYEALSWLLEDIPLVEVIELVRSERDSTASDLSQALDTDGNKQLFRVIEGEDDLLAVLESPLEKWRVFLHPTQRKLVNRNYSGAARVLGGAGTGKTVVAIHRAKRLSRELSARDKILFTTFTANLAIDIRDNLRKICTREELERIEVLNLDAWVARYMREEGFAARIEYDSEVLASVWQEAIDTALTEDIGLSVDFYREEWSQVILPQQALTLNKYIRCSRNGRGTRLDRKKRELVWKVIEEYRRAMKSRGKRDISWAMLECITLLEQDGVELYRHVIVDEGQDFGLVAMRLIRAIAGDERANDIFIVGDAQQRIYRNKAVLGKCGIQVRGRSSILRINYRTTEEIRKYALACLKGVPVDDFDGEIVEDYRCHSLTHGESPVIKNFSSANEEIDFIATKIKELIQAGVLEKDICITARTHKLIDNYIRAVTERGLRSYELKNERGDDRLDAGIRLATMHRVKGLEFQYVFVAGVNASVVPPKNIASIDDAVSREAAETAEKCLLYVALTRAQRGTYVTSYGKKSRYI